MKPTVASLRRRCLKLWGQIILKRNPVCVVCKKEKSKHPHHIFPRSRYRHLWFDLRNGAALCVGCHYRIHYDPVVPVIRLMHYSDERFATLVYDALNGRRRNPYGKKELAMIEVALKEAVREGSNASP